MPVSKKTSKPKNKTSKKEVSSVKSSKKTVKSLTGSKAPKVEKKVVKKDAVPKVTKKTLMLVLTTNLFVLSKSNSQELNLL